MIETPISLRERADEDRRRSIVRRVDACQESKSRSASGGYNARTAGTRPAPGHHPARVTLTSRRGSSSTRRPASSGSFDPNRRPTIIGRDGMMNKIKNVIEIINIIT
jgi:hypothetical protein